MAERSYGKVATLLYDPVGANMRATRSSLMEIGFKEVDAVSGFADFEKRLSQNAYDLVVCEASERGGAVCDSVRRLRGGGIGDNPFVVIILTTWQREATDVRAAIDCGADDLLLRPFSTAQMADRVSALVRARKDFIVTGDYIGPDRRNDPNRGSSVPRLTTPNTLKAVAENDQAALARAAEMIEQGRADVERERMKRLAMRVATSAEVRLEAGGDSDAFGYDELDRAARELKSRLENGGPEDAVEMAKALTELTARMRAADKGEPDDLNLARDLAMGAYAAFAGQPEADRSREEIDLVVAAIRARLQQVGLRKAG